MSAAFPDWRHRDLPLSGHIRPCVWLQTPGCPPVGHRRSCEASVLVSGRKVRARPDSVTQDDLECAILDTLLQGCCHFDCQRFVGVVAHDEITVFVENKATTLVKEH